MKRFKMNVAKAKPPVLTTPINLPPPTTHTVEYVGSVDVQTSTYSSDLLDKLLEKFLRKRQRKLSRKGMVSQLKRFRDREDRPSSSESTEILHPLVSSITSESIQLASPHTTSSTDAHSTTEGTCSSFSVGADGLVPSDMSLVSTSEKDLDPCDSVSMSSQSIPSLTDRQMHMTREDSCDVSIKLTRATPERMCFDEAKEGIEREGRKEREGKVEEREGRKGREVDDEIDLGDIISDKPTVPSSEKEAECLYSSDDDDDNLSDSHTTGSSTSCNTPDPTLLTGDLTPTDSLNQIQSHSRLTFHEQNPRLKISEQDNRPSSCPPFNPVEDNVKSTEKETEENTNSSETTKSSFSTYNSHTLSERDELDSQTDHQTLEQHCNGFEDLYRLQVNEEGSPELVQKRGREGRDAGFDILPPEMNSLHQSPYFRALGGNHAIKNVEGGRVGGVRGREEVKLVISPNMVQVVSAESSKVILRRTIRSIACCTQVGNMYVIQCIVVPMQV